MATNTSLLDTNLNVSPYFDDFDATKQFYKILFKPGVAVQVRELNQIQTTLQNQISSFGQNIFKEGSVIQGCDFTFDNNYDYIKLRDTYANGTALTVTDLNGLFVTNSRGLKATVVNTLNGFESQAPDLNTIYIKYIDSNNSIYANGQPQKHFDQNEELNFTTTSGISQGNVIVANTANAYGKGFAMTVTNGVIYKKGYFIYVTDQTAIVTKYTNLPDNVSVGFEALEEIITPNADDSLYDNAAGSPNFTAPGADRLKLTPYLVTRASDDISNNVNFFSLVNFKNGLPVTIKIDTQFNSIAKEVARRTFETNGNFVVNPFIITSSTLANTADPDYTTKFNVVVDRGLGYAEGYRVEYLNSNIQRARRGTDYSSLSNQLTSLNFGYYVLAKEFSGSFGDSNSIIEVELHSVAKTSITSRTYLSTARSSSTKIGSAFVRGVTVSSGSQGSANAQYRIYLFNVQMNAGYSFDNVKSVIYYSSNAVKGVADIVLDLNNLAKITNPNINGMIFRFGQKAIKEVTDKSYTYRSLANSSILTTGSGSLTLSGESYALSGSLSSSQMDNFIIVPITNGYSSNKTGTVQTWTTNTAVSGSSSTFLTDYVVGDVIYISSTPRTIVSISNNTFLTTDANGAASASGLSHQKAFIAGNPIPFATRPTRSMTIAGSTLTYSIGETANASFNVTVSYSGTDSTADAIQKILNRNVYVKIDCTNNNAGPWCLGLPDVLSIDAVYIGNTYSDATTNVVNSFRLQNGQKDSYYDLAYLQNFSANITTSTKILVKLTAFTKETSQGQGFFDISSYPIDDANTANTNAIQTSLIPFYTSSLGSFYDLRDCIDARPYASNTATVSTTIDGATINPSSTLSFTGSYKLPAPDSQLQADVQYYIGRVDRVAVDTNGNIVIREGLPDPSNPIAPPELPGTMTLGLCKIPPYPSLTTLEAKRLNRYDNAITTQQLQNRRYTMKDIAQFDKRITNLEYYTSLSLLESSAAAMQIRSTDTGQNRFQNGIFVDPFNGYDLIDSTNPKCYIAIDSNRSELRPAYTQMQLDLVFDESLSTGVQKHGDLILLNHTSNTVYINQPFASKFRNCIEGNIYNWRGIIKLTPSGSLAPDLTVAPDVINNLDLAQNWINLQNAWGTQWGNWETISTTYANTLISVSNTVSTHVSDPAPVCPTPPTGETSIDGRTPYYIWNDVAVFAGYLPAGVTPQNSGIEGIIGMGSEGMTVYGFS